MNIFILHSNLDLSVQYHVDDHLGKIISEVAQMANKDFPYHPMTRWVNQTRANLHWALDYAEALNQEWMYRYCKDVRHGSMDYIDAARDYERPDGPLTVPCGLPTWAHVVEYYRDYYRYQKQHLHSWRLRGTPPWL